MRICPKCLGRFPDELSTCPKDEAPLLDLRGDDPRLGSLVEDRYLLLRVLRKGGMGVVYQAWQLSMERLIALKVLSSELSQDADALRRFEREARITASLRCPYTISVYEFGRLKDGSLFLAMELLRGRALDLLLRQEGPQSAYRVRRLMEQVCLSLEEAHGHGLVHRDIKPANIMQESLGSGGDFVKVLDFGIVKVLDEGSTQITQTGAVIGTVAYMSPEQLQGGEVGPGTDIYALGVTIFELLSGRVPFSGKGTLPVMLKHLNEPVPKLRGFMSPSSEALIFDPIIQRCLAKKVEERYPSVAYLRAELMRLPLGKVENLPTEARVEVAGRDEQSELATSPTLASSKQERPELAMAPAIGMELVEQPDLGTAPTLAAQKPELGLGGEDIGDQVTRLGDSSPTPSEAAESAPWGWGLPASLDASAAPRGALQAEPAAEVPEEEAGPPASVPAQVAPASTTDGRPRRSRLPLVLAVGAVAAVVLVALLMRERLGTPPEQAGSPAHIPGASAPAASRTAEEPVAPAAPIPSPLPAPEVAGSSRDRPATSASGNGSASRPRLAHPRAEESASLGRPGTKPASKRAGQGHSGSTPSPAPAARSGRVLSVKSTKGLPDAQARKVVVQGLGRELRRCFGRARKGPHATGPLTLRIKVKSDGSVGSVGVSPREASSDALLSCVRPRVRAMVFPGLLPGYSSAYVRVGVGP